MKTLYKNIKIGATKGRKVIADADDIFSYIDSDFENWGTDKKSPDTQETELAVLELDKNMTFKQMFSAPEKMALTQGQILAFVKENKDKLHKDGYATFFLFKVEDEFFVAHVRVYSDGLRVGVGRFGGAYVWVAGDSRRMVVPQLALRHLDSDLTLESLAPSVEKAIEIVKNAGYQVSKIL